MAENSSWRRFCGAYIVRLAMIWRPQYTSFGEQERDTGFVAQLDSRD